MPSRSVGFANAVIGRGQVATGDLAQHVGLGILGRKFVGTGLLSPVGCTEAVEVDDRAGPGDLAGRAFIDLEADQTTFSCG